MVPGRIAAVDTETTGLSTWLGSRPFMITFSNGEQSACVEFPVDPLTRRVLYTGPDLLPAKKWLADGSVRKVFFNAKFDVRMCEAAGLPVRGPIDDVFIMARVCKSDEPAYGLKFLADKYAGIPNNDEVELKEAVKKLRAAAPNDWDVGDSYKEDYWLTQRAVEIMESKVTRLSSFSRMSPGTKDTKLLEARTSGERMVGLCHRYGTLDAERTIFLYYFYYQMMDELGVRGVYDAEMRLWPATYAMESRGVHVDIGCVLRGKDLAAAQRSIALEKLRALAWPEFNPASYKDKVELLVKKEGLEPLSQTPGGGPQVDKFFLEHYEDESEACGLVTLHGRADKAIGTYFDNYLGMQVGGLIHASFDQAGAKTLRYSCREPNFQNVPKRSPDGDIMLEVRRPLGPRPGHVWYMGDYSQIEARIFADKAGEEVMLAAFLAGRDVYDELAGEVRRLTRIAVTRRDAKDIFLGKLYGLGRHKMLKKLSSSGEVDMDGATAVVEAFDDSFPGVREYQYEVMAEAKRKGHVTNRYGQRINVDKEAVYKGVNYLIQSEAARLMKNAMTRCHKYLKELGFGWLVMTIHDELVFEFEARRRPVRVLRRLRDMMEDHGGVFGVATPVEFTKTTGSWLNKQECLWSRR